MATFSQLRANRNGNTMSLAPPIVPITPWRQLIAWIADPLQMLVDCQRQYGDVFVLRFGSLGDFVVMAAPAMIQAVLSQDGKVYDVGRTNGLAKPLVGKHSVMLMDGARHQRERKLLMPPFHGERLQTYAQQICAAATQVVGQWSPGDILTMRSQMQRISLEVIIQIVFGVRGGDRYTALQPLLTEWLNLIDSPLRSSILFFPQFQRDWGAWSPWGRMIRIRQRIYDLLQAELDERRQSSPSQRGNDILSLMMAVRDEDGHPLNDAELKDELLTLLFAGHETTATSLAWTLYELHRQPAVHERMSAELATLGPNPDPMAIAALPYLNAVCQETLRKYPVLPVLFSRVADHATDIGGYEIPAEKRILLSLYLVHYRQGLYPNPQAFQPERFLERQFGPAEYFPFGGGSRRCIGAALAQLEMKLVLAMVLTQKALSLVDSAPVKVQRRGFTLAPAGGVKMVVN
jgi:cytochrome P450 family 110